MKLKRILALVLAFCMVFTSMSFSAFAEGEETAPVATVNGVDYTSFDAVLADVKTSTGNVITLNTEVSVAGQNALDALTGDTLDLNEKTLTVNGNSYFSDGTTTFKNGNVVVTGYASDSYFCGYTEDAVIVFEEVNVTGDSYTTGCALFNANVGTVEIKNSEITVSGDTTGGVIYGGAVTIDNTTIDATNVCRGITNSVAEIKNESEFMFDGGETGFNCSTVTVDNSVVVIENATKRAVRLHNNTLALSNGATLTATNCAADIVANDATSQPTVVVDDTSTLNAVDSVTPVIVATVNGVDYTDLEVAINNAQPGDTVIIKEGTYALPDMKAGITVEGEGKVLLEGTLEGTLENLTLKNLHIKGANAQRWAYAKGDLVFENVTFEATSVYALHFDGITAGSTLLYKNCTIIGWAAMSGSPESVVFDGCTIKDNGSYGVIRTYFDAEIKNCTFDVDGANPDDVYQDGIHAVDSTVKVDKCTNVNGDIEDILNVSGDESEIYVDDVLVLYPTKTYEVATKDELSTALSAVRDGDTILLTADIDYTGTASLEINKAITIDLGGKTLTTYGTFGGLRLKGNCSLVNGTLAHKGTVTAIKAWDVVAIEDVVIDVAFKEEGKVIGGIVLQENCAGIDTIKNVTIKGDGLTNGIETYNCGNATEDVIGAMENVTIDAKGTGMLISAPCGTATNCTIKGGVTGIDVLLKGTYSATLDLVNCDVYGATQALCIHDEGEGFNNSGLLKVSADDATNFTSVKPLAYAVENADDVVLNENILALMPLEGEGTKDEPFVIENFDDFILFRDTVNAGKTYEGEYVVLATDIDLKGYSDVGNSFRPIGDKTSFNGTFDGGNHTISGLYISGWDLDYYSGSYGSIGLFSNIDGATIENLTVKDFELVVEGGDVAAITGSAEGTCVFKNINVENCICGTYNNGCGSIIAWSGAGSYTFENIKIDENTVLAGLWGSFDSSIGGVVGQAEPGATYNLKNVDIACRLDAYNDCTASYDYYNYRMCGMIIGRLEETITVDGRDYPDMFAYNITCDNVNVTIGEWANYHYCEPTPGLNGGRGMRVEPGYAYDGLPADFDHSQCTTNHMTVMPFVQLFGGAQYGVSGADKTVLENMGYNTSGLTVTDLAYIARHEAELNGEYYATIEEALDKAVDGDTIILHMDINRDVTIGKSVTIDGGNFKYTGNISVSGTTSAVTVKNVNFENGTGYAITTNRIKSITVEDCTVNNYGFGFLYANKSTPTVVVKNVTVDGGNYGFHWVYGTSATLENVTMTNVTNGLFIQNYAGKTVTLKNCNLTNINIWERDGSSGVQTFKFEGNNTVSTLSTSQYAKYVLAGVDATLTAPEGLDVTADNERYSVVYEDEAYRYEKVVKLGDDYYNSIQDAVDAANGNGTITLLKDVTEENITVNAPAVATLSAEGIVIDLDGHTLYGYIAPSTPTSLTVKNGNIVNTNYKYSAIEVNSGELTVENVNIDSERHAVRIDGAVNATINGGVYRVLVNNQVTAHAVNVSGAATVTIKDGTFYGPKGTPNGSAMGGSAVNAQTGSTVIIEGGNFSGGVNNTLSASGTLTVKGGVFDQDPTSYVADGYVATPNAANTLYMVTAERTLRLVPSATEVKTGNTFTVDVYVDTANVWEVEWVLEYDETLFEIVDMTTSYTNWGDDKEPAIYATNSAIDETKPVATYTFKKNVKASTQSEFTFKFAEISILTDYESVNNITVPCNDAEFSIKINLDYVVEVDTSKYDYYITGKKLVLVYTNATGITFDYDGIQMYEVTGAGYKYNGEESFTQTADTKVYALVVDAINNGVFEDYEVKVSPDHVETATVITYDKEYTFENKLFDNDVSGDSYVKPNDITNVYLVAVCNEIALGEMDIMLKADVDGDKQVNMFDAKSIINELYRK